MWPRPGLNPGPGIMRSDLISHQSLKSTILKKTEVTDKMSDRLKFNKVISRRSAYGLIWSGSFDGLPCAIKMVTLKSGVHYDKDRDLHRDGRGKKIKSGHFNEEGRTPFLHHEFKHRRAMKNHDFLKEAKELSHLSQLGLAPRVYGYGICDSLFDIHYGFIVMELMDGSIKDVLTHRSLMVEEEIVIKALIDRMHLKHGITHGDMKPSNLGVNLNSKGQIIRCLAFDCQKIRHRNKLGKEEFERQVRKDWGVFKRHIKWNRKGGP